MEFCVCIEIKQQRKVKMLNPYIHHHIYNNYSSIKIYFDMIPLRKFQ